MRQKIRNKIFCLVYAEWCQALFLPVVAPPMFFFSSAAVLEPIPILIWGVLVALEFFVLYKAIKYQLR